MILAQHLVRKTKSGFIHAQKTHRVAGFHYWTKVQCISCMKQESVFRLDDLTKGYINKDCLCWVMSDLPLASSPRTSDSSHKYRDSKVKMQFAFGTQVVCPIPPYANLSGSRRKHRARDHCQFTSGYCKNTACTGECWGGNKQKHIQHIKGAKAVMKQQQKQRCYTEKWRKQVSAGVHISLLGRSLQKCVYLHLLSCRYHFI